jgi:cytoskeletal protein RodZ
MNTPDNPAADWFFLKVIVGLVLFAAVVLAGVLVWRHFQSALPSMMKPVPVHQPVTAAPAPEVKAAPVEQIQPPKLTVYQAPVKEKLHLAQPIVDDVHEHVLSAVSVKADDHPQTVVSVVDDQTGATQTLVEREPLPLLALDFHGDLTVTGGVTTDGSMAVRVEGWQNVLDVKAAHLGAEVSCTQPIQPISAADRTRCYAGIGMRLSW